MIFFVSRDVVFSETEFPFSQSSSMEATVVEEEEQELWAPLSNGSLEK